MSALFAVCDRIAAFFGYLPAARVERAFQDEVAAFELAAHERQQAAHERQRRIVAVSRACELEQAMAQLEAEVADLRRTADRVRA